LLRILHGFCAIASMRLDWLGASIAHFVSQLHHGSAIAGSSLAPIARLAWSHRLGILAHADLELPTA
jgi:hypothetical protein